MAAGSQPLKTQCIVSVHLYLVSLQGFTVELQLLNHRRVAIQQHRKACATGDSLKTQGAGTGAQIQATGLMNIGGQPVKQGFANSI